MKSIRLIILLLSLGITLQNIFGQDDEKKYVLTIRYPKTSSYLPESLETNLLLDRQELLEITAAFDTLESKDEQFVGPSTLNTDKINVSIVDLKNPDEKIYSSYIDAQTQSLPLYILISKIATKYDPLYTKDQS
jgi:hypothetical protein